MSDNPQTPPQSQLDRMEGHQLRMEAKQDAFLQRLTAVETDQKWLKAGSRFMAAVLMAIVGKLAHLTFFSPK